MKKYFQNPVMIMTLKILVSMIFLGGIIYYVDFKSIINSFKNADPLYLFFGLSLAGIQLVVHFVRWKYLLRLISSEISNEEVATSLFVGFMAGFFTPAQVGEIAGRIASHPYVEKSHIIGITVIEKLYWAALTFVIGGAGMAIFIADYYPQYWLPIYRLVITFILGLIIAIFLSPEKIIAMLKFLPEKVRNHRFYNTIIVLENTFHNKEGWILFSLTSILYVIILLESYFLVNAFAPVDIGNVLMCISAVFFVKAFIFPISFGDLGVRESAAIFFFEKIGVGAAVAFNASILMSFANVIVPTIIGAIFVTRLRRK